MSFLWHEQNWIGRMEYGCVKQNKESIQIQIRSHFSSRKRLHKSELKKHQRKKLKSNGRYIWVPGLEQTWLSLPKDAPQKRLEVYTSQNIHSSKVPVLRVPVCYWVPGVGATSLYVSLYREEAAIQLCGITASTDIGEANSVGGQSLRDFCFVNDASIIWIVDYPQS